MAIEQGIWKLADSAGEPPRKLRPAGLADEGLLEEQIMQDVAILNRDWLLIGRQVRTAFDKRVDLLAIDANGTVIIIERERLTTAFPAQGWQDGEGLHPPTEAGTPWRHISSATLR